MSEVYTRSLATTAVLLMLGHEPIEVRDDGLGAPYVLFPPAAEPDLRRYRKLKERAEKLLKNATT